MVQVTIDKKNNSGITAPAQALIQQLAKRRGREVSGYKKGLQEKQTLRNLYGLSEKQFAGYVKQSLGKLGVVPNVADELIKLLEKRLDNVVFRMGVAKSRAHARQMVSHGYFLVNGRSVDIPSLQLKIGDIVSVKENKKKKGVFKDLSLAFKKHTSPGWFKLNKEKLEAKIASYPSLAEVNPPVEIPVIFEFYSR